MDVHCPSGNAAAEGEGRVGVAEHLAGVLVGHERIGDAQRGEVLAQWKERAGALTAERIYRKLREDRQGVSELSELGNLFKRDVHEGWGAAETLVHNPVEKDTKC